MAAPTTLYRSGPPTAAEADRFPAPPATRMFGDSRQPSPASTVGRTSGASLANLYQAKKANDSATVEQIKQHFQRQIEEMMQSQQRHDTHRLTTMKLDPPPEFGGITTVRPWERHSKPVEPSTELVARPSGPELVPRDKGFDAKRSLAVNEPKTPAKTVSSVVNKPQVTVQARNNPEVDFTNIPRGKSFLEARSAVQKQIEKMFTEANEKEDVKGKSPMGGVKHTMHGVSHVTPEDEDKYCTPPPVHYGVQEALRSRRDASTPPGDRGRMSRASSQHGNSIQGTSAKFRSLESLNSVSVTGKTLIDLGNIDLNINNHDDRKRRLSGDAASLASQVRLREKSREEAMTSRRISVHQDSFETNMTDYESEKTISKSIESLHSNTTTITTNNRFQKSKAIKYRIEYLGAVPLRSKASNLESLQVPIKELYFKHKALQSLGHSNLPGTLEISDTGLKVQYIRELHKGVQEIFNSFPTIAVWAAVKMLHKTFIASNGEKSHKFAFVPLISDPQNDENNRKFYDLDFDEVNLAQDDPHPPIFACVMRRSGMPKQLECHGFICSSSEDAIIIAANLYQSLLDTMKRHKSTNGKPSEPYSIQVDSFARKSMRKSGRRVPTGEAPPRPPRRKKQRPEEPRVATGLVRKRSMRSSVRSARSNRSMRSNKSNRMRGGKNVQLPRDDFSRQSRRSVRKKQDALLSNRNSSGDVFTKVTIGRTKSFAKTNNQYNLQELFRELKEKEGVDSIDDVLRRIISPNGMSFNDIKPVYRELLLKLAMTMSQDEIFERSKSIMASNKKMTKKSKPRNNSGSLGNFFKGLSKGNTPDKSQSLPSKKSRNLQNEIGRTTIDSGFVSSSSKAKSTRTSPGKIITKADISGPILIKSDLSLPTKLSKEILNAIKEDQIDDAYVSCSDCCYDSSCAYDSCACGSNNGSVSSHSKKLALSPSQMIQNKLKDKLKEDLSECDADSCIYSEKCYCSVRPKGGHPESSPSQANNSSASIYSEITADSGSGTVTDSSCYSANCYSGSQRSRFSSSLSTCDSPMTAWKRNTASHPCCSCSEYSDSGAVAVSHSLKFTRNLPPIPGQEPLQMRRKNSGGSGYHSNDSYSSSQHQWHDTLGRRRTLRDDRGSTGGSSCSSSSLSPSHSTHRSHSFSPTPSSASSGQQHHHHQQPKFLVLSAVDHKGHLLYHSPPVPPVGGAPMRHPPISRPPSSVALKSRSNPASDDSILSMKKSAEIAAMFSGARISQTTDLVDGIQVDESYRRSLERTHTFKNPAGMHRRGIFP